ncbi:hypothetical protein [Ktedonobacter sp. SOSP1-85]|uniref:hypothetical protein n=1 Tax=Ktedonobacter sp. SOSP1-85 TaxID=2778367 RepID=UPI0035B2B433
MMVWEEKMEAQQLNRTLTKAQILAFLGLDHKLKESKEQVMERLMKLIDEDATAWQHLLEMYPEELAVEPVEAQTLLQCTLLERRRWIEEGKLPVLTHRQFRKAGRTLDYPVHDRRMILAITQEDVAKWRGEHTTRTKQNRHAGSQKSAESRKEHQRLRKEQQDAWQALIMQWQSHGSSGLVATLELAYWTVWSSRWAKENQLKSRRATKYATRYLEQKNTWYQHKNKAMRLLAQTPYARLSFYRPPEPHKISLHLCETHYEEKREGYYESIWEYLSLNTQEVKACPRCLYAEEKDYYSLYLLEIQTEAIPDLVFSFHMPYPLGQKHFPAPSTLPRVAHVEQEGFFRFGRTLYEAEKITHREKDVQTRFEEALSRLQAYYPAPGTENGTNDTQQ